MNKRIYFDGDEFEHDGRTFNVTFPADYDHGAPWEECDGHGPVSDWTTRDKAPGEWILSSDRSSKRYYDAAEANRIAKRDGWGLNDEARAALARTLGRTPTAGEVRAEAVRRDYDYLRRWCNDQWCYVGVVVRHVATGRECSLWGIESDAYEYLAEVAHELADEITRELKGDADKARETLATIRRTLAALVADIRASDPLRPAVCDALRARIRQLLGERRAAWRALAETGE